jgi:hypothetical protein
MKFKIISGIIILLLIFALIGAIKSWYEEKNKPPISTVEYIKVPEIKETVKIKKVEVPVEKIVTIEREKIVEKVKMPEWFVENEKEQAIATASLPKSKAGYDVISTINTETGVGNIIAKEKEMSFFGLPNHKELYIKTGINTHLDGDISTGLSWKVARVGNVEMGFFAEGRLTTGKDSDVMAVGGLIITYGF